jgi:drug/metabolite transporter (DMT)-like permease
MVNWIIPAVIAILLASLSRVVMKSIFVGSKISSEVSSIIYQLLTGAIIFVFAVVNGLDFSGLSNLVPNLVLTAVLYAGVNYFLFKSFKQSEASIVTILFSTNAVWMLIGSYLFLGESINIQKILGIALIIGVTVIISSESGKFKLDRKLIYPLLAGFILGFAFVNDVYILNTAELLTYLSIAFILPGLTLMLSLIPGKKYLEIKDVTRTDLLKNFALAFVYALSTILTFYSYKLGAEASVVGPLQQLSVFGTVILSYFILKERTQMKKKLLATVLAVLGGVILTLS